MISTTTIQHLWRNHSNLKPLSSCLNLFSDKNSWIIPFVRIIILDMFLPICCLIMSSDALQDLSMKWSDRLTGVVSKKSDECELCLSSNRFNKAQRIGRASAHSLGSLWQSPLKDVNSPNILIQTLMLEVYTVVFLKLSTKMPPGISLSRNCDMYHNEAQIHQVFLFLKEAAAKNSQKMP